MKEVKKYMFGFPKKFLLVPFAIILIIGAMLGFSMIRTVPSGYVGIRLSWGKIIGTADEGLHFVNWIFGEGIDLVNVQVQAFESEPQSTASNDLQEVTTKVTVNYRVDSAFAQEVYRDFRENYEGRLIRPIAEDALKETTAKFTSTEMIQIRENVGNTLKNTLKESLSPYGIIVLEVSMTDFQFSAQFNEQLEATARAQKKALEEEANLRIVELQQQQKVILAKAEAEALILKATAQAEAQILAAQAQAKSMALINEQLNANYLYYQWLLQWNGELPYYYSGALPLPFVVLEGESP